MFVHLKKLYLNEHTQHFNKPLELKGGGARL